MTEFRTDISENGKKFELVFQTDNKVYFEKIQAMARECIDHKPVTQFDRIKAMSVEEMTKNLTKLFYEVARYTNAKDYIKQYLESEVSE